MKARTLHIRHALFLCAFIFGIFGVSWGQVTYTLGNTGYYTIFTDGTAGAFAHFATAELGMYANAGNKQVVAWRNFNIAGDNSGSNRNLQVGDVFTIQVNATAAFGSMGFSLNATPSTGSWANRHSNSRLYIQADGITGSWYVNSSAGNQSLNYNVSTTARDYQFRIYITSLTTCDVELYVGGSFHSRLPNLTMNGSSGANISHFVLYLNDDYNGANNTNIYWKQTTTHNASGTVNLGYYLPSGTYTPGLIQNGLTSNSTSTSNTNVVNVGGDAGSSVFLNQANTYTGLTTVNANATLKFGASSSSSASGPVGTTGAGTTVTSGGVLDMNGFSLTSSATEALTINGTGISSGGALINTNTSTPSTWAGTVALAADASIGGSGNITLNGAISGANSLTKIGTGTLTLGATNSFGGASKSLIVAAGTVAITSFSDNLGNASNTFTLGTASTSGTLEFTTTTGNVSRSFTVAAGGGTLRNLGSGTTTFAHSSGTYTGTLNGNLTLSCSSTGDIAFNLGISGTGGIIVNSSGSGKILMQPAAAGSSTYTGSTTITSGSLYLQGANLISNSSNLVLNGGTFGTGVTTGFSETLGTLALTANSTIALGTGSHTITFSASNGVSWTAGRTLTITGWSGSAGASGNAGKIFVGSSSSGLTATQLSQITFDGYGEATILSTGEVVPKPAIYRSAQSGNWGSISTWQSSSDNGSTWVNATVAPGSDVNTTITIQNNHTVSQNNNYNIGSSNIIVINAGGTLNMTSAPTTNMQFSSMTVNGTLIRNFNPTYDGAITIGNGGKYIHAVNGGSVPTCTWNSGSTFEVTGIGAATSFSSGGTQSFHHVIWNCTNQSSFFNFGGLTTVNGDFTVQSTGASPSTTSCLVLTNSTAITATIGGNLIVSGGFFAPFGASTASSSTLNISGNLSISGGTFDIYQPSSNTGTINLSGDFSMTGGTLTKGGSGIGNFNFSKNGTQTFSKSSGTISNAINFTVNSGSTLSMGTNILDGSTGTFTLSSGAGLITANTAGITTTGSTGTIQVSGARTYNIGANYTFNGSSAQVTGDGFTGANNLTINNSAGVTLSGNASLAGTLTLTSGAFTVGSGNTITVSNGGAISRTSGALEAGTGAGTFTFLGTGTVTGTVGFNNVNIAGGVNFGTSSTINGTLTINASGFVSTNAPIYASGSTLKYNSGSTYGRSTEWSATSGVGYPHHVQISSSTTLSLGANGGTSTARQMAGDLTIDANSTLTLNAAGQVMTKELTVKGNYINNGTTTLSGSIGGDLVLEGNLTDNNAFNANGRAIFFRGNNTQSITSNTDPLDIDVVRVEKSGGEIVLLQNLLVDETADPIQFAGTLSILNLNDKTVTFGKANTASQITMNSTSAIKGSATSGLTILGTGSFGTLRFDQTTPGTTNVLGTLNVNRTNTGSVTLANNLQIATSLVLTDGTLSLGANTVAINGSVSRTSGTINASSGTVAFGNASNLSLPTSLFTGNVANISKTAGAGTVTLNDNLTITGDLTTTASTGAFIVATSKELTINGTLTNDGTLTLENGATLVQTGSNPNAGSGGTYNVKQQITGTSSGSAPNGRGWYIGSPVSGATSNLFAPSNSTNLIYHWNANQPTPNWAQYAAGSGTTLDVGKGYAVRVGGPSTITFSSSILNNAPASTPINIACYKQASTTYQGFNLVSNPFASYLDWNEVWTGTNATNFESTIHYRVANASNVMVFDTYNAQNGQGTSNSTGVSSATRYIPPMQAFWVRTAAAVSTSTTAVNLSLDNSMRDHYTSVVNGWSAGLKSTAQDFPMFLRLNIEQGTFKDQMLVFLKPQASSQYDAYDSEKMFLSGYPQLYTQVSNRKLVFNGLNSNKKITVIPVIVDIPTAGLFTFRAEEFNVEAGLILLEDKQEGITQDLTINDAYTFYANAGTISNRFFIRFHQLDPSITAQGPSNSWVGDDNEFNEGGSIVVATNGRGKVTIQQDIDPLASDESDVTIRDAAGREVLSGKLSGLESVFQLDAPSGVYFVAVQLNGQVEVKKIFVQQ